MSRIANDIHKDCVAYPFARLLISASTTRVVKRKLLRRYLVVVKESGDTKASELGCILAQCQTSEIGKRHATNHSFSCKRESNHDYTAEIDFLPEQGCSHRYSKRKWILTV